VPGQHYAVRPALTSVFLTSSSGPLLERQAQCVVAGLLAGRDGRPAWVACYVNAAAAVNRARDLHTLVAANERKHGAVEVGRVIQIDSHGTPEES
jgi:hypothetical protein